MTENQENAGLVVGWGVPIVVALGEFWTRPPDDPAGAVAAVVVAGAIGWGLVSLSSLQRRLRSAEDTLRRHKLRPGD